MNQKLAADLLHVYFRSNLAEQKLRRIGLVAEEGFCEDNKLLDMICEQLFGTGDRADKQADYFIEAWHSFKEGFENEEQFDPAEILAWLAAGKLRSHPFDGAAKGIWMDDEMPAIWVKCGRCGHKWTEAEMNFAVPMVKDRVFKCLECGHRFGYDKANCL